MSGESSLDTAKGCGIGLLIFAGLGIVCALFLRGMVWLSAKALPWLDGASGLAILTCLLIFLPLSLVRRTRIWAANGFYLSSYLFGTLLFAYGCIVTYAVWGYVGLIVGLFLAGVGVVPVAYLAAIFHGEWQPLGELALGTFLTFGSRWFAVYLLAKASVESEAYDPVEHEQSVIDIDAER